MNASIRAHYLQHQSVPAENDFVFGFTVDIVNSGPESVRLTTREWRVYDSNGQQQPLPRADAITPQLEPGESYSYTGGARLETANGSLQGHYIIERSDGSRQTFEIPTIALLASHE